MTPEHSHDTRHPLYGREVEYDAYRSLYPG